MVNPSSQYYLFYYACLVLHQMFDYVFGSDSEDARLASKSFF